MTTEEIEKIEKEAEIWLRETDDIQFSEVELLTMFATHAIEQRTITAKLIADDYRKAGMTEKAEAIEYLLNYYK